MSKLIFGCGYLGERVGRLWVERGEHVITVSRNEDRGPHLASKGFFTVQADVTKPESLNFISDLPKNAAAAHAEASNLRNIDTVLFAVGFDRSVGNSIHDVYADGVKNVLAALPSTVKQFIYVSTTGVYGPANGEWVDETTPPNPQRDGGKASLAAENLLGNPPHLASPRGGEEPDEAPPNFQPIALRLAGIYGPDRIPYLAKLRAGEPIAAPSEGWLNLIHVEDGAHIVLAAEKWAQAKRQAGSSIDQTGDRAAEVFCVSDGRPVVRGEYYREVARRIGAEPPKFTKPDPNSPAAARATADKRISNEKLKQEIGYKFVYPSYQEGLAAILKDY